MPASVLWPGVALPPLQSPLQRIIYDSPGRVELRYEALRRGALGVEVGPGRLGASPVPLTARAPLSETKPDCPMEHGYSRWAHSRLHTRLGWEVHLGPNAR